MEVTNRKCHLGSVESGPFLGESGGISKVHEQLSSSDESHHEEDLLLSLEDVVHTDEEWMVCLHHNVLLKLCALNLVVVDDNILS